MKFNTGKIMKIIASGIAGLALLLILTMVYLNWISSNSNNSMSSGLFNFYQIILYILPNFLSLLSLGAVIYGIGHIIVLLQKLNYNISRLHEEKNTKGSQVQSENTLLSDNATKENAPVVDDSMWKRPIDENTYTISTHDMTK
ncbi:MAG: hypothetical protein ACK5JH_14580 [Anaerocolumna sp.]